MPNRIIDDGALYAWLVELAEAGRPCPSNAAINAHFGAGSPLSGCAAAAIARLQGADLIQCRKADGKRQIVICASGKATAGSVRAPPVIPETGTREAAVARVIDLLRQGKSELFIMKALRLPRHVVRYIKEQAKEMLASAQPPEPEGADTYGKGQTLAPSGFGVQRFTSPQLGFIGPSSTCRCIEDAVDPGLLARARAGDQTIYCGARSVPMRSWCAEHLARVVVQKRGPGSGTGLRQPLRDGERGFYKKCRDGGLSHDAAMRNVLTRREADGAGHG